MRRSLLVLLGAALVSALPVAWADPSDEEQSSLQAARQALGDGAFDLASDRAAALIKKYPKSELLPPAELVQAQALYQLGRSDDALAALNLPLAQVPDELHSDTLFWQAEALLDLERWPEAEQKYRALLALKNAPERTAAGQLGLAWAIFKQNREADALTILHGLVQTNPRSPSAQRAQLVLAKIGITHGQYQDAIRELQAVQATNPRPGVAFEVDYWLGQAQMVAGQPEAAAETYQKVTGDLVPKVPPSPPINAFPKLLLARSFLGLGRAEEQLHQPDLAMQAYGRAYELTENTALRVEAFHAFLETARTARQLPEAIAKLQEFAKTSDAAAPAALLAIGQVLAEDGQDDKAAGILESLLVAYGKSAVVPAASYQLGLLYARGNKPGAAAGAFQNCLAAGSDPALVRSAHFQLGLVLLNQEKDAAGAAAQFTAISTGTDSVAEGASYNLLLAQAALGKTDLFLKAQVDFTKRFPASGYTKKVALAQGLLLVQVKQPDDAKAAYEKAIELPGGGPDQKALLKALADLQYQTDDLAGAVKTCGLIVQQFPGDSLAAAQRSVLVSYEMKKMSDDQAEQALVALAQKYAKSPEGAAGWFQLGEFYFLRQDYVKAQDAFQQLTTTYPGSTEAAEAYFFAGRAAAAHNDYVAALALLDRVPEASPFKTDAQLWQGRVYQQQLNFTQACALADSVLTGGPADENFVAANLLKGECLFEMGATNASSYGQSLAAFEQIRKSGRGTVSERNEAAVREAKCLEKMGRTADAMGLYLDVLYGRIGVDPTTPAPGDFSWTIKAGWEAGRLREAQQDWRGAIEIYRRLEQIGGPHQQEFHDLQNKLRRDNYIYE